ENPEHGEPNCPVPAYTPRTTDQITDWYDRYLKPYRLSAGIPEGPSLTVGQIDALTEKLETFHRRSSRDSLFFEALAQQIVASYARSPDFKGLDTPAAGKIYRPGPDLDFSLMCIDTKTARSPDDTFAVTLFGMTSYDCQQCRPDHVYYRRLIIPVTAGTNAVTYLCRKDSGGCLRR
ncbi:MAG: hypothetical protein HYU73_03430, partial [Betaproteobacteria bacterium]|nr:hypothetical protein [Betaproteobacteria bacterium]